MRLELLRVLVDLDLLNLRTQINDRGGTLSPPPWTQQSNISQSSLKSSNFSRQSHISSNRSSMELPRSGTPIDRAVAPPTTFAAIQQIIS